MSIDSDFYILALDGGGTRGIYTAQLLAKIEKLLGHKTREYFDLVAGTSTGSIVAGAVATGIEMDEIVRLFECTAKEIFNRKGSYRGWFRSNTRKNHWPMQLWNIYLR